MKKVFLFLALLLPFIFTGCDDINFGLQELYNTYLIFDGEEKDEVSVFCKSEKLKISEMKECTEITDENIIVVLKQNDLIVDGTSPKVFYVPHNQRIMDHKKVDLFFKVTINNEIYTAEVTIPTLNTHSVNNIDSKSFDLKTDNEKKISAVFTFDLHMTI